MIPTLRTERLTLRAPEARDHAAYAAFWASSRSGVVGGPHDETTAWYILTDDRGHWPLRGFGVWVLDDGGACRGTVGFRLPAGRPDVELGWTLFSSIGRGYATEAARAALDWAGNRFPRIVSYIDRDNVPSHRVAGRLGARDTGEAPAHDPACTVWEHAA
jgi:RimJ/RimL family protein N-acetyltransferase